MITLKVTDQGISSVSESLRSVVGSVNTERVKFEFDESWSGLTRFACFRNKVEFHVLLDDSNECNIPWEVLTNEGTLCVGALGMDGDTVVKPTLWVKYSDVFVGTDPEGAGTTEHTKSALEQMIQIQEETKQIAEDLQEAAESGEFDGKPGYTPIRGKDYWTSEDQQFIVDEATKQVGPLVDEAKTAAEDATAAKESIENMGVSAESVPYDEPAEVEKTIEEDVVNLHFKIPGGKTGNSGVHYGPDKPTDPNTNVWINPEGETDESYYNKTVAAAKRAESSAQSAQQASDDAKAYSESAALSKTSAEEAAQSASTSAQSASTDATTASQAASTATSAKESAAQSAQQASGAASSASNSAGAASSSATAAGEAATKAEGHASDAQSSANLASWAATTATQANTEAQSAAQSASTSASQATAAATTAQGHATAASTAKDAAERAAEMAGNAQSGASQSAQAAANSAQAAERAKQEAQNAAAAFPAPSPEVAGKALVVNEEGNGYSFVDYLQSLGFELVDTVTPNADVSILYLGKITEFRRMAVLYQRPDYVSNSPAYLRWGVKNASGHGPIIRSDNRYGQRIMGMFERISLQDFKLDYYSSLSINQYVSDMLYAYRNDNQLNDGFYYAIFGVNQKPFDGTETIYILGERG